MFSLATTIQRLGKVREAIKQYKKILGLPRAFFKKVSAGEIGEGRRRLWGEENGKREKEVGKTRDGKEMMNEIDLKKEGKKER